jgi:hypothetical protein
MKVGEYVLDPRQFGLRGAGFPIDFAIYVGEPGLLTSEEETAAVQEASEKIQERN